VLPCTEEEWGECSEALEVYLLWGRDLPGGKPLQWYTRVAASQGCVSKSRTLFGGHTLHNHTSVTSL
jgi:hypothetical protein